MDDNYSLRLSIIGTNKVSDTFSFKSIQCYKKKYNFHNYLTEVMTKERCFPYLWTSAHTSCIPDPFVPYRKYIIDWCDSSIPNHSFNFVNLSPPGTYSQHKPVLPLSHLYLYLTIQSKRTSSPTHCFTPVVAVPLVFHRYKVGDSHIHGFM